MKFVGMEINDENLVIDEGTGPEIIADDCGIIQSVLWGLLLGWATCPFIEDQLDS